MEQQQQGSYSNFVPPPPAYSAHSAPRSVETLVVVLAAITIVAVLAGICARICGGRHSAGSADRDIEGWVEKKCRSCLDSGVSSPPPPPPPPPPEGQQGSKPAEAKK
uniref:Uncharacterized protein n=1 Tax=Ananas comosus var. bracteatus TaxID=296719 RepID=A0A6V7PNW9_ANACO|nr:unnamed protein product [Ananas comosus var. bracteatus]